MRDLLADFREQEGPAFLVITSDLAIAQAFAEDALVFKDGRMVARGPIHELLSEPKEPALIRLIEAATPPRRREAEAALPPTIEEVLLPTESAAGATPPLPLSPET
jgi:ABC-type glutathione transport system ATPase component